MGVFSVGKGQVLLVVREDQGTKSGLLGGWLLIREKYKLGAGGLG